MEVLQAQKRFSYLEIWKQQKDGFEPKKDHQLPAINEPGKGGVLIYKHLSITVQPIAAFKKTHTKTLKGLSGIPVKNPTSDLIQYKNRQFELNWEGDMLGLGSSHVYLKYIGIGGTVNSKFN